MKVDEDYFRAMYAASPDPWSLAERWYDHRKYTVTLAALRHRRYRAGFEPGCSIGLLSASLAARCDTLLCTDLVPAAVDSARQRLAGTPNVTVERQALPEWPDGEFDLIVLSEVLYYLSDDDLAGVLDRAAASLVPGGDLVAVHWRHPVDEHRQAGDDVQEAVVKAAGLEALARYEDADFRLDLVTTPPSRSVAQAEGLCR